MKPLDLAMKYMEVFFSGRNIEHLDQLLARNLTFEGPFCKFSSAGEYLDSLRRDPPEGMRYKILKSFENESCACLIYQFAKPGVTVPMAQIFEIEKNKIRKIILIFDTGLFL